MKAKGYTRHRFWGEYSARIALLFNDRDEALESLPILNAGIEFGDFQNASGGRSKSEGWYHIRDAQGDAARAVFVEAADPVLAEVVKRLVSYGAEEKRILSLAKSIDYGEEFYIDIPVEDKNQLQLL